MGENLTEKRLAVLAAVAERLNAAGIVWALGASALLYFKGITDCFNDIDIMVVTEEAPKAKRILEQMGRLCPPNPHEKYRTEHFYEFVIDGVDLDLMGGFIIVKDGVEFDCSLRPDSVAEKIKLRGQAVPLQSVSEWRRYYELMGRTVKVEMIDSFYDKQ